MRDASLLTAAVGELSTAEVRTLLSRTDRSTTGRGAEVRPRLREAVRAGDLAPEDVLRRLDEDTLEALLRYAELAVPPSRKHADLLAKVAVRIKEELHAPAARVRRPPRRQGDEPASEVERLREELDRVLDERARLEAKNASLRHEVERLRTDLHDRPGLDATPDDLAGLLRSIGIADVGAYKLLYRSAAKLLHPDKNPEGERAFRLLTKIRDLLEGRG